MLHTESPRRSRRALPVVGAAESATGVAGLHIGAAAAAPRVSSPHALPPKPAAAVRELEPCFFPQERFQDVSRGNPAPHSLTEARRQEVGLTRAP